MPKPSSDLPSTIVSPSSEPGAQTRRTPLGPPIPWWVTALDVLILVLVLLTLRALIGDGMRLSIGGVRLSFTSGPRLVTWTAALVVVRHVLWRKVPWHARVSGWTRRVVRVEALRAAWPPYVMSRLLVLLVAYIAVWTVGFKEPTGRRIPHDVLDLFARYDAGWYFAIARLGYGHRGPYRPDEQHPIAFFPGFPLLIQAVGKTLAVHYWYAGIIIVVVAFLVGLVYLYRLAREDLPPDQAQASLLFLAFYPFAVCYSAVLTEAVFLLVAAAAFLYFRRGEFVKAIPFAGFAGLLRPNGFLMSIPLALTVLLPFARARGWIPGEKRETDSRWTPVLAGLAVAALPVAGMLVYSAFVNSITGDPFAWMKAQQAWGRSSAGILAVIDARTKLILASGWAAYARSYPIEIFEASAALFALGAVWPITRRFGLPYGLFVAMSVLPPFFTMGSVSLGRYTAPLFPVFLWLGASIPPQRRVYWLTAFAMLQGLVATLFFTSRPPY